MATYDDLVAALTAAVDHFVGAVFVPGTATPSDQFPAKNVLDNLVRTKAAFDASSGPTSPDPAIVAHNNYLAAVAAWPSTKAARFAELDRSVRSVEEILREVGITALGSYIDPDVDAMTPATPSADENAALTRGQRALHALERFSRPNARETSQQLSRSLQQGLHGAIASLSAVMSPPTESPTAAAQYRSALARRGRSDADSAYNAAFREAEKYVEYLAGP
jgi:hypothetical protein